MAARIALCHEWLTTWGGSEQVAGRIADALDIEDVFTFASDPATTQRTFGDRRVCASRIGATSFARKHWRLLLPLMDRWWRSLDLRRYEVVVTTSHAAVNSIEVGPHGVHISYCLTPMRYAWDWRSEAKRLPAPLRPLWPVVATLLRRQDRRRAAHVDLFIADSSNVAARIREAYGRRSIVIYPPVRTDFFTPDPDATREDFFLCAGRLVPYKAVDKAVAATALTGDRLVIAGAGPELRRLRKLAGANVGFVVDPSDDELRHLYRTCRGLIFPGVEDFGIVPVEAQACSTPVVALAAGGVLESVQHGVTGCLYAEDSPTSLAHELRTFDAAGYDRAEIRRSAERFSSERFEKEIRTIVRRLMALPVEGRRRAIDEILDDYRPGQ